MSALLVIQSIPKMSAEERRVLRNRASEWLQSANISKVADAQAVLEALDAAEAHERNELAQHVAGLDNAQRVAEAFTRLPLTETERLVIQVLLDNPGLSSDELAEQAGWKKSAWHMHFGAACTKRGHLLWPAPFAKSRGKDFYCGILADCTDRTNRFTMKPDAVEGFRRIGLTAGRGQ